MREACMKLGGVRRWGSWRSQARVRHEIGDELGMKLGRVEGGMHEALT